MTTDEFKTILRKKKVSPYKFAIDNEISLATILMICKGYMPPTTEVIQALREYNLKKTEYM
jgi:predicted transcriptional regulator